MPGVESAEIDYDAKIARVTVTGDAVATAITKALDASGQYHGELQN